MWETTAGHQAEAHRLQVDVHQDGRGASTLADDVRKGLSRKPKRLPSKYFYDEEGSRLFDRICDTPEYYQTRTELALLESIAGPLLSSLRPTDIVELGSGAARKTRVLFDTVETLGLNSRYIPFDVCEEMLRRSSRELLQSYPWLRVRGVVGDYDRHLDRIPGGGRRLIVFLGGTIGNFTDGEATAFLRRLGSTMGPGDHLLLGTDLVKDEDVLHAAYNDREGVTAAFNKNVLAVINRELDGSFPLEQFEHVAFYDKREARIEMHLRARRALEVPIDGLRMTVCLEKGETIHTEISRKFTKESVAALYQGAGLEMVSWHTPPNGWFGISVARRRP